MIDNILSMLGLALKAGKVEVGEEPVGSAARAKKARVIFIASDAAASSARRARHFGEQGACLCLTLPAEKDALGRALGRTSCAMCAVTDIGFAGSLVKKLAAIDDKYNLAAERLELKAQRAAERKKEQLQHEKNIRMGKKKVVRAPEAVPVEKPAEGPRKPKTDRPRRDDTPRRSGNGGYKKYPPKKKEEPRSRFEGSRPVKKGKGSKPTAKRGTKSN